MKQLVLTVVGQDQSGLVEQVANAVMNHKGSWLASNLSHLAGYFAGIVQIEVPDDQISNLKAQLADIDHVTVEEETFETQEGGEKLNFVITGNDRPGIVHELSTIIKHNYQNIFINFTTYWS